MIVVVWTLSLLGAMRLGYGMSKLTPYSRTFGQELSRRTWLVGAYARATLAVLSPAYGRRYDRKRLEAVRERRANLVTIERSFS